MMWIRAVMAGVVLGGAASAAAADSPAPFRAARSVHLGYPAEPGEWFYTEMVIEQSVNGSYFMACGWNTGYFGLQQLRRPEDKVAIFSVWDPTGGDDPNAVKAEDRVEVLFAGEGTRIRRFGGEGTGGQCMWDFPWKIGETNRLAVQARVDSDRTAYTGWLYLPATGTWKKLATFRTQASGSLLRGYYSFIEDFRRDVRSVGETRRARFGRGGVRAADGRWMPLRQARFTASNASWESKDNIDAGEVGGWFYLATGGSIRASRPLRSLIELPGPAPDGPGLPEDPAPSRPQPASR